MFFLSQLKTLFHFKFLHFLEPTSILQSVSHSRHHGFKIASLLFAP